MLLLLFIIISKYFFFFRDFNIYKFIIPDRMHTLDLGLFKYMLEYTKDLLNDQCKRQVMQNFEQRLMLIPRHQRLKILKNIFKITCITADEFRNLMKVIIFALDNLYKDYRKPGISNERLCSVYHQFFLMYIAS